MDEKKLFKKEYKKSYCIQRWCSEQHLTLAHIDIHHKVPNALEAIRKIFHPLKSLCSCNALHILSLKCGAHQEKEKNHIWWIPNQKPKVWSKLSDSLEWRMKVTEGCKFSLIGSVPEPNGLIWYTIAIHISVQISSAVGPTQGRRQLQRRWKKVHLASVVTDVSVYLHGFLHCPANGRDYFLTCFSLQLAQNLESAPTYPVLGLQWRPWLRPTHLYHSPT